MNINEAFPERDPGINPVGNRVLVQIRRARKQSRGGIILTDDSRDTERDVTQIAKVISMGGLAYKNNSTLEPWPEGNWCKLGDYVRIPRYIGERWNVSNPSDKDDVVIFGIVRDTDVIGVVTTDPTEIAAYI